MKFQVSDEIIIKYNFIGGESGNAETGQIVGISENGSYVVLYDLDNSTGSDLREKNLILNRHQLKLGMQYWHVYKKEIIQRDGLLAWQK